MRLFHLCNSSYSNVKPLEDTDKNVLNEYSFYLNNLPSLGKWRLFAFMALLKLEFDLILLTSLILVSE